LIVCSRRFSVGGERGKRFWGGRQGAPLKAVNRVTMGSVVATISAKAKGTKNSPEKNRETKPNPPRNRGGRILTHSGEGGVMRETDFFVWSRKGGTD